MPIKIPNRWTGQTIYEADVDTMQQAILLALKHGINLTDANLFRANLTDAKEDFISILDTAPNGDTPADHPIAAIVLTWIDQWIAQHAAV